MNGEGIAPSSSPNVTFHEGDVVRLRLPGGGGHGDPARRRRERIEADLKAGYVTPEGACRVESICSGEVRGPCRQVTNDEDAQRPQVLGIS